MSLQRIKLLAQGRKLRHVVFNRNRALVSVIIVGMLIGGLIGCASYQFQHLAKAASVQTELESEYRAIQQLAVSKSQRYHASHKVGQAAVGNTYETSLPYPEIRKYYDSELSKNGWVFTREEDVIYGNLFQGKNYGGKHSFYRKREYIADLQYAGEQEAEFGWTYAFSLSWGLYD